MDVEKEKEIFFNWRRETRLKLNLSLCSSALENVARREMVYSSSINVSLLEQIGSAQENLNETSVRRFDSFEAENRPASIVFRRVNYHVYDKKQHRFSTRFIGRGSSTKQILFNVNGHFAPGMNAILGFLLEQIRLDKRKQRQT